VYSGLNPLPSSSRAATRPRIVTSPPVDLRVPARICSSVLLPEPLRPMTPSRFPRGSSNETSSSAVKSRLRRRPKGARNISASRSCGRA
jgi:hypothetical protein